MPRPISTGYRQSLESQASGDVDLIFLTISHSEIASPIRVVSDSVDYLWGIDDSSNPLQWIGFSFDLQILTNDDSPPKAQLTIQNVDTRIGRTIAALRTAARLRIQLLCSIDFDLTQRPRVPLDGGDPHIEYDAASLFLSNVKVDAMRLTGDVVGWDYLQRAWPTRRATKDAFPALFR